MHITRSAKAFEWNLNTLIQIVTLVGMFAGGIAIWIDKSRDIEELQEWRDGHEALHKERLAEVRANDARTDERFKSLEADMRKVDNIGYRVTVVEGSTEGTAAALKELQKSFSDLSGDIKVVREILQRIEERGKRG